MFSGRKHKPGGLWWSYNSSEHLFGLSWCSDGSLILASVLGGGGLRQAEREGGTFARRQDGEFAGVDRGRRGLGERHLWAALFAFVLHNCLCLLSEAFRGWMRRHSLADVQDVLKQR